MPMKNRLPISTQIKFEISEIELDIKIMQVELEHIQTHGMLLRQTIREKERKIESLQQRMLRLIEGNSSARRHSNDY